MVCHQPSAIFKMAIPFFIHTGVWNANSMGSARGIFQGSQGLKLFFLGGKDKFSRGVIQIRASQGKSQRGPAYKIGFLRVIFGITPRNSCFFQAQK